MATDSKSEGKRREKRFSLGDVVIGIILIGIIWVAYSLSQPAAPSTTTRTSSNSGISSTMGSDFTLPVVDGNGLTGQSVSLSSFRGKVVLLEFMAPECAHCQKMVPVLEQLASEYGGENVVFVTVAGQGSHWFGATPTDVATFIRTYNTNWVYVVDTANNVFNAYGVTGTPTFFIIGKSGQIAASYVGETQYATLAADLTRSLAG
jgi:thiol-disulfide isomerase/thioredoxin